MSRYLGADSAEELQTGGLGTSVTNTGPIGGQKGQKELTLWDFLPVKRVLAGSGNPMVCSYFICS